jgi:Holliday junction DNA helicase RuvA
MIRSLKGHIEHVDYLTVVLGVSGVGYLVYAHTLRHGYEVGDEVHLHTHQVVRENTLELYGFPTREELAFFELLLTIPKIGPKSAMQILAQADILMLTQAIRTKDATMLHKLSGIGKKTSENIVQFLHDKMTDPDFSTAVTGTVVSVDRAHTDAIDALVTLGYPPHEARSTVRTITVYVDTKDLVTQALRLLSRG